MSPLLDLPWLETFLEASLRGSVLLLAAMAATTMMRRAPAAARHLVWTAALAGVLLLPLLAAALPPLSLAVLPSRSIPIVATPAHDAAAPASDASPAAPAPAAEAREVPTGPPSALSASAPGPVAPWGTGDWLLLLWGTGAALVLARLICGLMGVWLLERRARMVTDAGWLGLAHALAAQLGLQRGVTLLRGDRGSVPMTWGVLQPAVWLPADADGWTAERRTVVLAHELAHVRRKDAVTQWIGHLAVALHWFNPLVWIAVRKQREERERACDDTVLALGTQPAAYADHLLQMVRIAGSRSGPAPAMAMARRSQFEGRLLAILDSAERRGAMSRAAALCILLVAALGTAPVAAVRATAAPADRFQAETASASSAGENAAPVGSEGTSTSESAASSGGDAAADTLRPSPISIGAVAGAMRSDAGRADLLEQVAQRDAADRGVLTEVARASGSIESPSQRARVLTEVARQPELDGTGVAELLNAVLGITSDSNRRQVLETLLDRPDLDSRHLVATLRAAGEIGSASERRFVLEKFLARFQIKEPPVRAAFFGSLRTIPSDTERRFLLETVLKTQELCDDNLHAVIASTVGIGSDSQKRFILTAVATGAPLTGKLREAYLAAAQSISSDSERATALSTLIRATPRSQTSPKPAPIATVQQEVWNSDHELIGEHHGKPSFELSLHARNVVRSTDRGEIRDILPGGSLRVEHTIFPDNPDHSGGTIRRSVRATPRSGGGLQWTYRVDGVERPWDAEGQAWLSALLRKHTK